MDVQWSLQAQHIAYCADEIYRYVDEFSPFPPLCAPYTELGVLQQRALDTGTHLGSHRQQRQGMEGGGERLSQLHARLQQEAEKIRQWKTATEMDLKQKDAQLQEALHTVDTQRRTLVELQVCVFVEERKGRGKRQLEGVSEHLSL